MQDVCQSRKNSLGWYIKHHIEPVIVAVRISNTVPSENSKQPKEYRKQYNEEGLNNWKKNAMHGEHLRQIEDKSKRSKSKVQGCTEALICSVQKQALTTDCIKLHIDKTVGSALCIMCRVENEVVSHIVGEFKMLAQKEYKEA